MSEENIKAEQQAKIIENILQWLFIGKQMGLDLNFLREAVNNFDGQVLRKESIGVFFNLNALNEADILQEKNNVLRCLIKLYEALDKRDEITAKANAANAAREWVVKMF